MLNSNLYLCLTSLLPEQIFAFALVITNICEKMITQEQRQTLLNLIKPGDYDRARGIYRQNTGRDISVMYLWKFIKGDKPVTGLRPGSHQPQDMYRAIAESITARLAREARLHQMIDQINQSTLAAAQAAAVE